MTKKKSVASSVDPHFIQQQMMAVAAIAAAAPSSLKACYPQDLRPLSEKTDPDPRVVEVVILKAMLGFPASELLREVHRFFNLDLPHLSPNAIACLYVFEWAMRVEDYIGRAEVFAKMHEASCHPKKRYKMDGSAMILAYGSVNFQIQGRGAPGDALQPAWYALISCSYND
ncbi:hypothetical protein GUJ93_ZPchr0002g24842 [Zizania palustris]|uniref:Uncharacterized protein n=1 Tax=Zizania palustris TaxID=103762 RepID=A0A8J5S751_ZIZPA|nr:hypothetical protein GUJ93_ZPchr0002g24842 [Zizania palustris]